ncbi:hypothetical protein ES288_D03G126100v1 [Gossypium darwinii]|uniref:Uncharacterized protein n=1 Tax=Gossypium darwinii TaxID=34276 RepID=A0A5D2D5B3_GOSDA|nr:hypothetical protein ES288_D03G126100v1 [Gossypium darwinii]
MRLAFALWVIQGLKESFSNSCFFSTIPPSSKEFGVRCRLMEAVAGADSCVVIFIEHESIL